MELKRPGIVTLLAGMQWAGALFWALLLGGVAYAVQERALPEELIAPATVAGVTAVVLQIICGIGLWKLRQWGRILQMVLACAGLLVFPVGTFVAVLMLVYLFQPGVALLFSGRPAEAMTPEEAALLARFIQPSNVRRLIVIAAVLFVSVAWATVAAAIAIPGLLKARMSANEKQAIDALTSLSASQAEYAAGCGHGGFAANFDALDSALPDATIPASKGIAGPLRGVGGYWVSLQQGRGTASGPVDCHGVTTVTGWYAAAIPQTFRSSGMRSFAINDTGVMWQAVSADPPTEPFGPPATQVPQGGRRR